MKQIIKLSCRYLLNRQTSFDSFKDCRSTTHAAMDTALFKNTRLGSIPDYWSIPLGSYNNEVCFKTSDSVVAAPRLLMRTVFPELDSLLCEGCVSNHERVTIIAKDITSNQLERAFRSLAANDPSVLASLLELTPLHQPLGAENANVMDDFSTNLEITETHSIKGELLEEDVFESVVESVSETLECPNCEFRTKDKDIMNTHKCPRSFLNQHKTSANIGRKTRKKKFKEDPTAQSVEDINDTEVKAADPLETKINPLNLPEIDIGIESVGDALSCKYCGFTAKTQMKLFKHTQKSHNTSTENGSKKRGRGRPKKKIKSMEGNNDESHNIKAENDDNDPKTELKKERRGGARISKSARLLQCNVAGCEFATKVRKQMNVHTLHFHASSKKCKYCSFTAQFRSVVKRHTASEHQDKNYRCDSCDFKTKGKPSYSKHMRIAHSIRATYKCLVCEKEFKFKKRLAIHESKGHHNHKCPVCEKEFNSKKWLDNHERRGHNFPCNDCGVIFNSKDLLKEHKGKDHTSTSTQNDKDCQAQKKKCQYCGLQQNFSWQLLSHEKYCSYKDKIIRDYKGSSLFQDSSFGWV